MEFIFDCFMNYQGTRRLQPKSESLEAKSDVLIHTKICMS